MNFFLRRKGEGSWEILSGAMEAGENTLDGILREIKEELGGDLRINPLGCCLCTHFFIR